MSTTIQHVTEPLEVLPPVKQRKHVSVDFWLASVFAAVTSFIVAFGIDRFPSIGGDEGIYTEQSWAVLHGTITPYTYTYDHPFFGWAQISVLSWFAQLFHIGGQLSVVNVRAVMVLYAFGTTMLVYGICRRLAMNRITSTVAVAVTGLSPLFIVMARQVFLDNIAIFWVLLAVWLLLTPSRRQWVYAAAGFSLTVGVLSKETVLLFAPALLLLLWQRAYRPIRAMALTAFITSSAIVMATYPLFAALRNELFPGARHVSLWSNGIMYQLANRTSSGALWTRGSDKWNLMSSWLNFDHYLLVAGAVAGVLCLAVPRLRIVGLLFMLWAIPVVKPGGYLPSMYVIAALPLAGIAIGGIIDVAFNVVRKVPHLRTGFAAGLVAVGSLALLVPTAQSYRSGQRQIEVNLVAADNGAVSYVKAHVPRDATVLTDDAYWVDLQRAGFGDQWSHVSYYKFDLDPSATKALGGWQGIDYIISTTEMRNLAQTSRYPATKAALSHATVVASFGSADNGNLVQVLKVTK